MTLLALILDAALAGFVGDVVHRLIRARRPNAAVAGLVCLWVLGCVSVRLGVELVR